MEGIVKLLGIVIVVWGVICFIKPNLMKKLADFFMKGKWIFVCAISDFIIGLIFLNAAWQCAIPWIVILFGIVVLIKGILILVLGQKKIESLIEAITEKPPKILRGYALIYITLGVILIYSV